MSKKSKAQDKRAIINRIGNEYVKFQIAHQELEETDLDAYDREYEKWLQRMVKEL